NASVEVETEDGLGKRRKIRCISNNGNSHLHDDVLNVHTYDFAFQDLDVLFNSLPGSYVSNPPEPWSSAAVSAHANAAAVAEFLRKALKRNGIDNAGGSIVSSVNCVSSRYSPDGRQWSNAAWYRGQMVYGQKQVNGKLRSYAVGIDVVAHEIFHGVTDKTARLEYAAQSGALNESYSDIFGVIISNFNERDISQWNWQMGEDLNAAGVPLRDFQNPPLYNQPAHMNKYLNLPVTANGDWGGVHINSGIHNFAAYKIMTAKDAQNKYLFTAESMAALFYLAMTQYLTRNSNFAASRRAVEIVARTLFRNDPINLNQAKLKAISSAFDAVGIV
ncbi:MAG TPA: M4 family metallopeptidase, partial [Pyrinomonadaceae bacterium]